MITGNVFTDYVETDDVIVITDEEITDKVISWLI